MIQTRWIVKRLHQQWPNLEIAIEQIRTKGDQITHVPLTQVGGDGVFVTEIEHALTARKIDLAVHSLKDLPTAQPEGLRVFVVGPREDTRDVFVARLQSQYAVTREKEGSLAFPASSDVSNTNNIVLNMAESFGQETPLRIGTCSLRRTAQIRALYPTAEILPLRGNVDTRLRKLEAGDYDGIILASAGLHRLGLQEQLAGRLTYLPIEMMMPAPGQGALALEARDEPEMRALLTPLRDSITETATCAERMFMRRLGAGCYLPIAAYGRITGEVLTLLGLVISLDGQQRIDVRQSIPWMPGTPIEHAEQLGVSLAEMALTQGAYDIIHEVNRIREQVH